MKFFLFYLRQVALLGSAGFAAFIAFGWWQMHRLYWANDTFQAWFAALFIVAIYLIVVATPLQVLCRRLDVRNLAFGVGLLSGPIAVGLWMLLFTHYSVTFHNLFSRALFLHVSFALIGLWFAYNFQRYSSA